MKKAKDTEVITHKSYSGSVLDLCKEKGWTAGDVLEIHPDHAAKPEENPKIKYANRKDETGFRCKIIAIPEFDDSVPPKALNNEARDAQFLTVEWPIGSDFITALSPTVREWNKV